ncbi:MAG: cytochrome c oxidase subunit 3 [Acidimicrobiales bacterium]
MALVASSAYGPAPLTGRGVGPPRPPDEVPKGTNILGVLLVLVADMMLLATLLAAWFAIKAGSPSWPPPRTGVGTYIPSVVTITVTMSAFTVQWVVSAVRRNDQRNALAALILSLILGICIFNAQWYYMARASFGVDDHAYGTLFHLLLGYHLVHMGIAILALTLLGARAMSGHFSRENYEPLKAAAAVWQYSNLAWFVIMTVVFLFSAHA